MEKLSNINDELKKKALLIKKAYFLLSLTQLAERPDSNNDVWIKCETILTYLCVHWE